MLKQVALIVLDGWGYREEKENNAIAIAKKPFFDKLWSTCAHTTLKASGESVGLPEGQMGNSEVGHMTIGAGRPLDQDLIRINKGLNSSDIKDNLALKELFDHVKKYDSTLHISGLVSPGGVHSHIDHLFSFLKIVKENGIKKVAIHVITDGRDTSPQAGASYLKELEDFINKLGFGEIASVSGRLYAMDRDKRWDRLQFTTDAIFKAKGDVCDISPSEYLKNLYKKGLSSDEYLKPFVCSQNGKTHFLEKNDGFFLFNFRADRMRMLTEKILEEKDQKNIYLVTMTSYGKDYNCPVIFPPIKIEVTLGKVISDNNLTQAHIAETEKFAHATYFLNCGREQVYKGEEQILVQSPKDVLTYDLAPKMSAREVADAAILQIEKGTDFIFINFANADMVGHTANVPAIIEAIEEIDEELGRVIEEMNKVGGEVCITADHGNAEMNIDPGSGSKHTAHTSNPVPCIITGIKGELHEGTLADIAPTVLKLLGLSKPKEMTGNSLIN